MMEQQPQQQSNSEVTALVDALRGHADAVASRHVQVSYGFIGIIVLILALMGGVIYWSNARYDKQVAALVQQENNYRADLKQMQDKLSADQQANAQREAQQQVIVKVVHDRDTQADQQIAQATAPQSQPDVMKEATDVLKPADITTFGPYIGFMPADVQNFVGTKIDRDRLFADLNDEKKNLNLEQQNNTTLRGDNTAMQNSLKECNGTLDQATKVVKQSRLHKILGGLKTAGEIGLAAVIGVEVGKIVK